MIFLLNRFIAINRDNAYPPLKLFYFILQVILLHKCMTFFTEWKPCKIDTCTCVYCDHPSNEFIHKVKIIKKKNATPSNSYKA